MKIRINRNQRLFVLPVNGSTSNTLKSFFLSRTVNFVIADSFRALFLLKIPDFIVSDFFFT